MRDGALASVPMVPGEALALDFLSLMTPLLPPGKLAVRIVGVAQTAEERRAARRIVEAARRSRAHRRDGLAVLEVRFASAPRVIAEESAPPRILVLHMDALTPEDRVRRLWVMACLGALLILLLRLHQLAARRRGVPVVGKHVDV